jgi:hypothetical protein
MTTKKAPAKAKVNTSRAVTASAKAVVDVSTRENATTAVKAVKAPVAAVKTTTATTVAVTKPAAVPTPEQIAIRAYEIYMGRGCAPGHEQEDWAQAEKELSAKTVKHLNN